MNKAYGAHEKCPYAAALAYFLFDQLNYMRNKRVCMLGSFQFSRKTVEASKFHIWKRSLSLFRYVLDHIRVMELTLTVSERKQFKI